MGRQWRLLLFLGAIRAPNALKVPPLSSRAKEASQCKTSAALFAAALLVLQLGGLPAVADDAGPVGSSPFELRFVPKLSPEGRASLLRGLPAVPNQSDTEKAVARSLRDLSLPTSSALLGRETAPPPDSSASAPRTILQALCIPKELAAAAAEEAAATLHAIGLDDDLVAAADAIVAVVANPPQLLVPADSSSKLPAPAVARRWSAVLSRLSDAIERDVAPAVREKGAPGLMDVDGNRLLYEALAGEVAMDLLGLRETALGRMVQEGVTALPQLPPLPERPLDTLVEDLKAAAGSAQTLTGAGASSSLAAADASAKVAVGSLNRAGGDALATARGSINEAAAGMEQLRAAVESFQPLKLPTMVLPTIPKLQPPELAAPKLPTMLQLSAPQLPPMPQLPAFEFTAPKLPAMPQLNLPEPPSVDFRLLDMPPMPESPSVALTLPRLPALSTPLAASSKLELPAVAAAALLAVVTAALATARTFGGKDVHNDDRDSNAETAVAETPFTAVSPRMPLRSSSGNEADYLASLTGKSGSSGSTASNLPVAHVASAVEGVDVLGLGIEEAVVATSVLWDMIGASGGPNAGAAEAAPEMPLEVASVAAGFGEPGDSSSGEGLGGAVGYTAVAADTFVPVGTSAPLAREGSVVEDAIILTGEPSAMVAGAVVPPSTGTANAGDGEMADAAEKATPPEDLRGDLELLRKEVHRLQSILRERDLRAETRALVQRLYALTSTQDN